MCRLGPGGAGMPWHNISIWHIIPDDACTLVVTDLRLSLSPSVPLGLSDRLESIAELTSLTLQTEARVWQDRTREQPPARGY
jgi:hypothetical protein